MLKKRLPLIVFTALAAALAVLIPTHASHASILDAVTGGFVGIVSYFVIYIVSVIVGFFISILTYLVAVILQMNGNVASSFAVQSGFSVALAIANLGFVFFIILIAMATMLKRDSYGVKSHLWRLVVAAILVNFSLVIGGVVINLANTITTTFLDNLSPAAPGQTTHFTQFADSLAGAFAPQKALLLTVGSNNLSSGAAGTISNPSAGSTVANIITPLIGVVASAGLLVAIVITLAALVILLLIRYLMLSFLLIVMPFAWLLWIFEKTRHNWSKWWSTFFKWTFFAPIVVFFLWLAIATAQSINCKSGSSASSGTVSNVFLASTCPQGGNPLSFLAGTEYSPNTNGIIGGVSSFFGSFVGTVAQALIQDVLIIGLAVGGMIAAEKLSIKGADVAVGAMKGVGNAAKNYAGKQGKKAARWAGRKARVDKGVEKLRTGQLGKLSGVPGVGWAATRLGSIAGRAVEPHLTNASLVEQAKKKVPDDINQIKQNLKGNMNTEDTLAHLSKLVEKGELTDEVIVGRKGEKANDYLDQNKQLFEQGYGQGKFLKDADKNLGGTKEMREAEKELQGLAAGTAKYKAVLQRLQDKTKEFVNTLQKSDMAKLNVNSVFGKKTLLRETLTASIFNNAPHLTSSAMPKMKSPTIKSYTDMYAGARDAAWAQRSSSSPSKTLKQAYEDDQADIESKFNKGKTPYEAEIRRLKLDTKLNDSQRSVLVEDQQKLIAKLEKERDESMKKLDESDDGRAYNRIKDTWTSYTKITANNVVAPDMTFPAP